MHGIIDLIDQAQIVSKIRILLWSPHYQLVRSLRSPVHREDPTSPVRSDP